MSNDTVQHIDLLQLDLIRLSKLKQQFDQEIQLISNSLQKLKIALGKFQDSYDALEEISQQESGKEILVPLTNSMYVPGAVCDIDKVMVDIGTGYYVEKAKGYFQRKTQYLSEQIEKIQAIALDKIKIREAVIQVMEMKIQSQMQSEQVTQA